MDPVAGALREAKRTLVLSKFFNHFTTALLVFLAAALILLIFKISWTLALVPALLYLLPQCYLTYRRTSYQDVERAVPELEWQLRTVADNYDKDNEVVKSLKEQLAQRMKNVRSSFFYDSRITTYKLVGIFGLSLMIVFFSTLSISFEDFKEGFPTGLHSIKEKAKQQWKGEFDFNAGDEKKLDKNLYGKESVVELGTQDLQIQINPAENRIDPGNTQPEELKEFSKSGALKDIGAAPDQSYQEKVKKEETELIKGYMNKLSEYANKGTTP